MAKRPRVGGQSAISAAWRASRGGLVAVILFSAFINLLKFAIPLYFLQVLDRVPVSRSVETLVVLTVMVLVAVVSGLSLEVVRRRMLTRWATWIERRFGPRLVSQELSNPGAHPSADINSSLGDLGRVRLFVAQSSASWLDVVWAPVFLFSTFLIDQLLGYVALVAIIVLVILAVLQEWATRDARRIGNDAARTAGNLVQDAERNRESVGAFSMAPALTERWQVSARGKLVERELVEARQNFFRTLIGGVGQIMRISMLAVGLWLSITSGLTLGGVFAARVLAAFGYNLVERAARNWRTLREALISYANLKKLLAEEEAAPVSFLPETAKAPLILDKVSYRYPGQRDDVFKRLSFRLLPGEALLISGTAGTGKTTLSRLIVGLLEPRYGHVRLGDLDISRLPTYFKSSLVGYMPQHTEIFSGTVRENIARMGGEVPFSDVVAAAELAGIHERIVALAQGYDTLIGPDISGLSGSERKRIALARAFMGKPRLIVLDEPMANLDDTSRRALGLALKKLKSDNCTIVATQAVNSTPLARMADKFLILGAGSIEVTLAQTAQGPHPSEGGSTLRSVT